MSLTLQDHSILTLYFENNEQKDKWIDDFQRVLYQIHSEMSDLLTVGDDESNFSNSQIVSMNGEEEREPRPLHTRLSEVDESALNSPSLKSASPIKLNSGYRKDDYYSEEESPKSPDKRKDSKSKKKGKEKLSPDGKGFLSHMKNFLDESKFKFDKGSLDSLESPVDKKTLSRSNRKYKSKDSLNVNTNSDADAPLYGSYNNILGGSDADVSFLRAGKLKKFSFHDSNFYSSQCSVERGEDESTSTRVARDTTETSSVLTGDNATLDGNNMNDTYHNFDIKSNDAISENENDSSTELSRLSLRRNGQGNIFNEKSPMTPDSNILMNYDNNNSINITDDASSNHSKKDKLSESFKEGYTWVLKDIRDLGRHRHHSNDSNSPNSTK